MNLPFSWSGLSLLQGELFLSHQKKISEMEENWSEYPFSDYKLQPRTKKSFQFVKHRAVCGCGRKANVKCIGEECSKCCSKKSVACKAHKAVKKRVRVS